MSLEKLINNDRQVLIRGLLINGGVMRASYFLRKKIEKGYTRISGQTAPKNPRRKDVSLGQTLLWAAGTGAVLGVVKTLLKTGLNEGIDRIS